MNWEGNSKNSWIPKFKNLWIWELRFLTARTTCKGPSHFFSNVEIIFVVVKLGSDIAEMSDIASTAVGQK